MGQIKDAVERLRQAEQEGSGWIDRKLGEAQLVSDALEEHERQMVDDLVAKRDAGVRRLSAGEASQVAHLHRTKVQPAIEHATQFETNAERSERAKEMAKKGGARAPEANDEPAELQAAASSRKRKK